MYLSLQVDDFFEGVYQLKEELVAGGANQRSQWRAVDYTNNQKKEVVIDMLPYQHDKNLHWAGSVAGLIKVGQAAGAGCRYFVWEKEKVMDLYPVTVSAISDEGKSQYLRVIDSLPFQPNETILSVDSPEYWYAQDNGVLIFYRKQVSPQADPSSNKRVVEYWKGILCPSFTDPVPAPVSQSPEPQVPPISTLTKSPSDDDPPSKPWREILIAFGVALAVGLYIIKIQIDKRKKEDGNTDKAILEARLIEFNRAIENGIRQEKRGDYLQAVESFTAAAKYTSNESTEIRKDSLGKAYEAFAQSECIKYRATQNPELYFIPNQYYHYASILTGNNTLSKCE